MKLSAFALALLFTVGATRSIVKRNTYGDEPVTPAPVESEEGYASPEPIGEAPAAEEYAPAEVEQEAVTEAPVEKSGYRQRREAQNSYGDEPVVEETTAAPAAEGYAAPAETEAPAPAEEYAPAEVEQAAATDAPAVEKSGYRLRREAQNSYGDEPVVPDAASTEAPAEEGYASSVEPETEAPAPAEEYAPAEVTQEAVTEAPAVEKSGYRLKRGAQNSYGDEPVEATEAPAEEGYAASAEPETEAPAPAEEYAPAEVEQAAVTDAPAVEKSGYRLKREAQNSYGDEPVVPSTEAPAEEGYAASVEPETEAPAATEEYAPAEVEQEAVTDAPAVEKSGYRL